MYGARNLFTSSLAILLLVVSVSAGLYGTAPIATTVWSAGRSQTISWIDDKSMPHLGQLGPIDIELFSGEDSLIATLAREVDPKSKSQSVWISPAWGHNSSNYYICFASRDHTFTVYTSTFTITDMSSISPAGQTNQSITSMDGLYTPYLTLVLPNTTSVSALAPQRTSARSTPTAPPVTSDEEDAYLHSHGQNSNSVSGLTLASRIDFERLKFRIVFILWPALIGITMAL